MRLKAQSSSTSKKALETVEYPATRKEIGYEIGLYPTDNGALIVDVIFNPWNSFKMNTDR